MEELSYNEIRYKSLRFRHIFFPNLYSFISEAAIACVVLLVFNASELSNSLLNNQVGKEDPLSYAFGLLGNIFTEVQKYDLFQQVSIFLLWAIIGALLYVLVFRIIQIAGVATSSVNEGVKLYKRQSSVGIVLWFASLHDFFIKSLITFAGISLLAIGTFVCFGVASQELRAGLIYSFPTNALSFAYSFIGALLSIRFVILGLCLLSSRFRNWYTEA